MECGSTCVVGPNGERLSAHVDSRRSTDDTVVEVQSCWQRRRDGPCFDRAVGGRWYHVNHGNTSGHGLVLWIVIQNNTWLENGDVDGMRCRSTRCVCIDGKHG